MIIKRRTRIILAAGFFVALFFVAKTVSAVSNVRGAVWWGDQYQYLYMDCLDDVTGDKLDVTGNLTTPPGFKLYSPPCTNIVHHISIDDNGNFTGSAWNYSKGLVTFAATSTPPDNYAFNTHCLSTCNASNSCSACYNETTQQVYGWARVLGDGTWIKLDSQATATMTPVALQSWDLSNSVLPGHGIQPGDFIGYATTTAEAASFNCESEWNGTSVGNCATRSYKVYVSNLQVGHLSAPNWSYSQACASGARTAVLKWYLKSGTQTAYRIIVNTANSTSTPAFDSGKISGTATQYICPGPLCAWTPDYGTDYYWWIQLWDGTDQPTAWYQYGLNDGHRGTLDEHTDGTSGLIFHTYSHEFPNPYFTWDPYAPVVGQTTNFVSNYSSGTPLPRSAYNPFAYLWTTNNAGDNISNPTEATTSIQFFKPVDDTITLRVTDVSNYYCSTSTTLHINFGLPVWREVKAEQY